MSRTISQRLERALKTTSRRGLRLNLRFKRRFSRRGQTVFISALPKSGSTFLVNALSHATGYQNFFLGYQQQNEQDLYLPNLIDAWSMDVVSHQHTRATAPNLQLMNEFAIRPVILTRNAYDAAVSLTDHLENESRQTPLLDVPADFASRPRENRLDAVIDLALPWYVQFVAGWATADHEGAVDCLWLRYEDVMADGTAALRTVLAFHGVTADDGRLASALEAAKGGGSRLNKGVAGRGMAELTPSQKQRIDSLTRHYPAVDFSMMGLPGA
ncbi:MAG: sulfotransferase domain-containing protein [Alphaproteobacteria bacterium]|jgi:hypothetical protein|nr:sulfotransferase domain-containing protein [Alphaproteobacteria bacterium]MDP6564884.1 sulfotransferase domain-containing protein [Alphaproteobacteria bacterium]MDP6811876.1 sulfotransferase domain-containing protein [Alphaproteobacteria bacterium]